jgi:hypothetical protein
LTSRPRRASRWWPRVAGPVRFGARLMKAPGRCSSRAGRPARDPLSA